MIPEAVMLHKYLEIASTPSVTAARRHWGSAAQYARLDGTNGPVDPVRNDRLGPAEIAFIVERDGFYLATVSETGWPYVQFRGGPPGFLRVLDETTLGYADLRGNRQYITVGNAQVNNRVSLFLMDYAHQRRLKIFGRLRFVDAAEDPQVAAQLSVADHPGTMERAALITVEAFDWNCPQHITPRFTQAELVEVLAPIRQEIETLRAKNARLRSLLEPGKMTGRQMSGPE
jgi:predicted pyridoxine 5'-phosphate oxidase superfamily flavin-nucleotide-binding protein